MGGWKKKSVVEVWKKERERNREAVRRRERTRGHTKSASTPKYACLVKGREEESERERLRAREKRAESRVRATPAPKWKSAQREAPVIGGRDWGKKFPVRLVPRLSLSATTGFHWLAVL